MLFFFLLLYALYERQFLIAQLILIKNYLNLNCIIVVSATVSQAQEVTWTDTLP